jgi:hypothetical protein
VTSSETFIRHTTGKDYPTFRFPAPLMSPIGTVTTRRHFMNKMNLWVKTNSLDVMFQRNYRLQILLLKFFVQRNSPDTELRTLLSHFTFFVLFINASYIQHIVTPASKKFEVKKNHTRTPTFKCAVMCMRHTGPETKIFELTCIIYWSKVLAFIDLRQADAWYENYKWQCDFFHVCIFNTFTYRLHRSWRDFGKNSVARPRH